MDEETKKRSATKSVIWRILGVIVLAIVTFAVTRNWITTGLVTVIHHTTFLIVYYLHERLWNWIGDRITGKKRYIYRMLLYEIVLGHLILGSITLLITGSWLSVSLITPIYIFNKMWMYVVYDMIWKKIKWGME